MGRLFAVCEVWFLDGGLWGCMFLDTRSINLVKIV
jgi:hypothetical protein